MNNCKTIAFAIFREWDNSSNIAMQNAGGQRCDVLRSHNPQNETIAPNEPISPPKIPDMETDTGLGTPPPPSKIDT